jgi:hypothetical protein
LLILEEDVYCNYRIPKERLIPICYELAKTGNTSAMMEIAEEFKHTDRNKYIEWLQKASDSGLNRATYYLSLAYVLNNETDIAEKYALELLDKGIFHGDLFRFISEHRHTGEPIKYDIRMKIFETCANIFRNKDNKLNSHQDNMTQLRELKLQDEYLQFISDQLDFVLKSNNMKYVKTQNGDDKN